MDSDIAFHNWLAGFADGEGHFSLAGSGGTVAARFIIEVRQDDRPILEEIRDRIGVGIVYDRTRSPAGVDRVYSYLRVTKISDCAKLCDVFEAAPLRAKKAADFKVWAQAVRHIEATPRGRGRDFGMLKDMAERLKKGRVFRYKKPL